MADISQIDTKSTHCQVLLCQLVYYYISVTGITTKLLINMPENFDWNRDTV